VEREMVRMVRTLDPAADRDVHSAFKEACEKAFGMSSAWAVKSFSCTPVYFIIDSP
jgi:hypothetical protein